MMMACGHAANGKDMETRKPVCVICQCDTITVEPDLRGRRAKCMVCSETRESNMKLPFFEYKSNQDYDSFYDGCRGFD